MRYFIKKLLLFLIPVAIYVVVAVLVDPYNYFPMSKGIVNAEIKKGIPYQINNPLYELIDFKEHPSPYILLGSSQTGLLTPEVIKEYTGKQFVNISYGGGSLPEVTTTFWEVIKTVKLKEVYIGLSFFEFNGSQYKNRVPEALDIKANCFSYIFSKSVLESVFLILKSLALNSKVDMGKPDMTKEEFWKFQLDVTANRWYSTHSYPTKQYGELQKISNYCTANNIKLTFIITPNHVDAQQKVQEFHFEKDELKFKEDLKMVGDVYDFNYPNSLTTDKNNFTDPFHIEIGKARIMIEEIFANKKGISIFSKCKK